MTCDCGCGEAVTPGRKFRRGHWSRGRRSGEHNPHWNGDRISYSGLHWWVRRNKERTGQCTYCGQTERPTEWANISGQYLRELDDYVELCRPCHRLFDKLSRWTHEGTHYLELQELGLLDKESTGG